MSTTVSQITSRTIVCSTVYSRRRSKKTSKVRVTGLCEGIHRWPVNSPHKGPITRKMFSFDDVIMMHNSWDVLCHEWQIAKQLQREGASQVIELGMTHKKTQGVWRSYQPITANRYCIYWLLQKKTLFVNCGCMFGYPRRLLLRNTS